MIDVARMSFEREIIITMNYYTYFHQHTLHQIPNNKHHRQHQQQQEQHQ